MLALGRLGKATAQSVLLRSRREQRDERQEAIRLGTNDRFRESRRRRDALEEGDAGDHERLPGIERERARRVPDGVLARYGRGQVFGQS